MNALCGIADRVIKALPEDSFEIKQRFEELKQNLAHVYADEYRMWQHVLTSKVEQLLPKDKNYKQWQLNVLSAFTGETVDSLMTKYGLVLIE